MKILLSEQDIRLPKKVSAIVNARKVEIKGPRGVLKQDFSHMQVSIKKTAKKIINVSVWFGQKRKVECLNTTCALIKNMIKGVTEGNRYKMRLVYAHYPILFDRNPDDRQVMLRNYFGQKEIHLVNFPEGVDVYSSGVKDEIYVDGNDLQQVSLTAARIHQSLRPYKKDIRKYLDGAYVTNRTTIS